MTFDKSKACCFTGHRKIAADKMDEIIRKLRLEIDFLVGHGITHFITGGALGFDTLAALAVLMCKQQHEDIRLHLILPCPDQYRNWKQHDINVYNNILSRADSNEFLSDHYHGGVMQMRNRAMVDRSSCCICYWDKSTSAAENNSGGTLYTVNYVRKQRCTLINIWDEPPEESQLTFNITE